MPARALGDVGVSLAAQGKYQGLGRVSSGGDGMGRILRLGLNLALGRDGGLNFGPALGNAYYRKIFERDLLPEVYLFT